VVPSARAANFTMNRKAIRNLAAETLKLKTARYAYADTFDQFRKAVSEIGIPAVVKPLMSSSGKGQSVIKDDGIVPIDTAIEQAWEYAMHGTRGDLKEVIVEAFIPFESEITLLTVTQKNGVTLFCPPIGHRQERGDYQESWQPHPMSAPFLDDAKRMANEVTRALTGVGIWGVEFFLTSEGVYFSELSPRPHDTGMVTLAGTQNLSEFDLHVRAILGLPIPDIVLERIGASAVILAKESGGTPTYTGVSEALLLPKTDVRIFGKPTTRPYRRMGVALSYDHLGGSLDDVRMRAIETAKKVQIKTDQS